jgi:hypothetical protein
MNNPLFNMKSVIKGTLVIKLMPAPEPNLFESRSRSGNKKFRLHNTGHMNMMLGMGRPAGIGPRPRVQEHMPHVKIDGNISGRHR